MNKKILIIDFRDHTVTIDGETCSFFEAGLCEGSYPYKEPNNEEEFFLGDYDEHLRDKNVMWDIKVEFEFINI